jgi:hypothetical protein
MLNLTAHDLLDKLEDHIAGDKFLLEYAGDDFDALRELVDEFIGNKRYEVAEECLEKPKQIIARLLNIFIWEFDRSSIESYTLDALIGYVYLLRSHVGFRENEKVGN